MIGGGMCVCVYVCASVRDEYTYIRGEKGLNLPYLSNCQGATAPSPSAVSHATLLRLLYTPAPKVGVCVVGERPREREA